MIINKEKVIIVPNEFRGRLDTFRCPCPVCVEKAHTDNTEKAQIVHAKNLIENIFESTALNTKDFQINVAYADTIPVPQKIKANAELRSIRAGIKTTLAFTTLFNRKFRHPLTCKLNAQAESIQKDLNSYDAMVQYGDLVESRLWKFEEIAKKTEELIPTLDLISSEAFLESERITFIKSKISHITKENKLQLRKLFLNALKFPEFEPHCTYDDYHLPYS
ncbi:MAG: hypothetical protein M3Q44_03770 [bacterium]|nr:hypothetical protein [bacterium]